MAQHASSLDTTATPPIVSTDNVSDCAPVTPAWNLQNGLTGALQYANQRRAILREQHLEKSSADGFVRFCLHNWAQKKA
jgi:hypothetical protein